MRKKTVVILLILTVLGMIQSENLCAAKKKVLVAGGAGFLGSHLCKRLLQEGCEVFCLDNLATGNKKNIEPLCAQALFHFILQDVCDRISIEGPLDEIYNLASPASPPHYQKDPVKTFKTNVFGMFNLLEVAKEHGAKIFQASTSEIYGDPLEHPQKESYWGHVNSIGIRSCYDEGKRGAETLCFDYFREYGIRIKVARIFNTYGPQMDPEDGRVVSNFIMQALENKPITIYGDGSQTRSFCYVQDLVNGIRKFMDTPDNVTGPMNLGNPDEYTVKEIAEEVVALTGSKSSIVYKPLPLDDPKKRKPDISLAERTIHWQPQIGLREGLLLTVEYFKTKIGKSSSLSINDSK